VARTSASDLIMTLMFHCSSEAYLTPSRHAERSLPKDDSSQR
jgi:hypothetical protein